MDWSMTNCCYPRRTLRRALTAVKPSGSPSSSSSAHLSLSPQYICISKSLWTSSPAHCISLSDSNQMVLVLWLQQRLLPDFISRTFAYMDMFESSTVFQGRGRGWWCCFFLDDYHLVPCERSGMRQLNGKVSSVHFWNLLILISGMVGTCSALSFGMLIFM